MYMELRHKIAESADIDLVCLIEMLDNERGKCDLLDEQSAVLISQFVKLTNVFPLRY